ncbi:methylenetetrahydrofolate--tRNA-(uracil(54)-C(5))-methyltransferase (FADH(2)-oxidizing) TrmFO [Trichlorobacter sp.]|uniref:methylenetetrahydrofolate--tRNA-(uracil(54)- C(5))-methyltransferase (FADH(2)-oxidizing) TrmFO n=1 Tax=Trichlorobacter sp. TaxID=2911007 RepID=UPI002A362DDE|nr:methylenetetrahydrofolate--tRNA-(uracil(54)-C(5))-methyltransferase (FADH(2)-oxidizing) TrmFO [Trichlorobacter sp.]MDY0383194.1 methylenetetrahydrofolate--tRNA-(uracil(54)-C(5))-methyltransferase (FADH(2)-oxidizing) TrmFO [Trichlorobacter sp.]
MTTIVTIIGAGLAGCEAAWQAAERGIRVRLYEMKPQRYSPAHQLPGLAELVCSNSLRGADLSNAVGLLKEELRRCGSLIMQGADATRVPAGGALAVDREQFSVWITERIAAHPNIELIREEVVDLPTEGLVVIASGPLTSDTLADQLSRLTGDRLYFYDAIAPIVSAESLDLSKIYAASRYGKGDGDDYLNCPLDQHQYATFLGVLRGAEKVEPRSFEKLVHFDGCMPIEELAALGDDTLRFGPMKPVGLPEPVSGEEPWAVVQLRAENREKTLYNLVGFQTKMTWPEQRRVLRMIPGLEQAEFVRLGAMHRNTFINAPSLLSEAQQLKSDPRFLFAGQITGVEGYVESAGSGFLAGLTVVALAQGREPLLPPRGTALGALVHHITNADPKQFQPMNVNYGLFPPLEGRIKKKDRKPLMAERALVALDGWKKGLINAEV